MLTVNFSRLFQFQFVVLRLFPEARAPCAPEHTACVPWRPLYLPSAAWQSAALSLWRCHNFQELLKEKEFYVGFPVFHYFTWPDCLNVSVCLSLFVLLFALVFVHVGMCGRLVYSVLLLLLSFLLFLWKVRF